MSAKPTPDERAWAIERILSSHQHDWIRRMALDAATVEAGAAAIRHAVGVNGHMGGCGGSVRFGGDYWFQCEAQGVAVGFGAKTMLDHKPWRRYEREDRISYREIALVGRGHGAAVQSQQLGLWGEAA